MSTSKGIRIRDNATIRELHLSEAQLQQIQEIKDLAISPKSKNERIKKIIGGSTCCICGDIPIQEVKVSSDGVCIKERYCKKCARSVYQRQDPIDKEALARKYNCIIGNWYRTTRPERTKQYSVRKKGGVTDGV